MVRIGFIGCHEISWFCLKKICECALQYDDEIVLAFDLDEDKILKYSSTINLNSIAKEFNFKLYHTSDVGSKENIRLLKDAKLDVLFIIGWHRIVPQIVLDQMTVKLGIHSSLLPKDRGSSPINWQIIKGERIGGVTLFHLTAGVDEGPIIDQYKYGISNLDTIKSVYFKAISSSLSLLESNWKYIHNLKVPSIPQDESKVTVNPRRKPSDGLIDWTKNSIDCYNWIRALTFPYPGAFTFLHGKKIFIWSARLSRQKQRKPGIVIEVGKKIIVSTGKQCIELDLLQAEGEPICNADIFSKSYNLKKGDCFSQI